MSERHGYLNKSVFILNSVLYPRDKQSDASGPIRFGSTRVMLHEQVAVCQPNELGSCLKNNSRFIPLSLQTAPVPQYPALYGYSSHGMVVIMGHAVCLAV